MITVADYEQAERDLTLYEERLGWRIHAVVYGVVMSGLVVLNLGLAARTDADFPWSFFVLVCWGIALAVHHRYATRWSVRHIGRQELLQRDSAARRAAGRSGGTGRR